MGWFCQHFGFGEIDLAYGLSNETGVSVADIFALKSGGMGWGNIKKALRNGMITPTPPVTDTVTAEPGNGNKPVDPVSRISLIKPRFPRTSPRTMAIPLTPSVPHQGPIQQPSGACQQVGSLLQPDHELVLPGHELETD